MSASRRSYRDQNRITALEIADRTQSDFAEDDVVVLATPPWVTGELLPDVPVPDEFSAIVNAHFKIEPPASAPGMLGLIGGTAEWVFAFPDRISVTVSGADRLVDMGREELAQLLWRDVAKVHGLPDALPPWQIVKEKRATFAATPAQAKKRAKAETRWKNLIPRGRLDRHRPSRHHRRRHPLRPQSGRIGVLAKSRIILAFRGNSMNDLSQTGADNYGNTLDAATRAAAAWLIARQKPDGHWVGRAESNACMEAQWCLALWFLGLDDHPLRRRLGAVAAEDAASRRFLADLSQRAQRRHQHDRRGLRGSALDGPSRTTSPNSRARWRGSSRKAAWARCASSHATGSR